MTSVSNIQPTAPLAPSTVAAPADAPIAPAAAAVPASDAASGVAALSDPTPVGNRASTVAPTAVKTHVAHAGSRDLSIDALKSRAAYITNLLKLDTLPASFRSKLEHDLVTLKPVLQEQVAKDWLTNVAYASGARADIVNTLDTATIYVVPAADLASDAMYNEEAKAIYITDKMVAEINTEIESLAKKHLIDAQHQTVTNVRSMKTSSEYHAIAVTQALIGAHEAGHMHDDMSGRNITNAQSLGDEVAAYTSASGSSKSSTERTLVREYLRLFELPQYAAQERYQWEMGAAPNQSKWMTIDNHGRPLSEKKALDNLYAFAMESGAYDAQQAVDTYTAQRDQKGYSRPGYSRPGEGLEGYSRPGYSRPGEGLEGYSRPGEQLA